MGRNSQTWAKGQRSIVSDQFKWTNRAISITHPLAALNAILRRAVNRKEANNCLAQHQSAAVREKRLLFLDFHRLLAANKPNYRPTPHTTLPPSRHSNAANSISRPCDCHPVDPPSSPTDYVSSITSSTMFHHHHHLSDNLPPH